jgi:hypothetical protein
VPLQGSNKSSSGDGQIVPSPRGCLVAYPSGVSGLESESCRSVTPFGPLLYEILVFTA